MRGAAGRRDGGARARQTVQVVVVEARPRSSREGQGRFTTGPRACRSTTARDELVHCHARQMLCISTSEGRRAPRIPLWALTGSNGLKLGFEVF